MTWQTLIQNNAAAIIGLCGVIVGTALTAIVTFALQGRQRRWALDDNRREWKRQYREKQLNAVLDWVAQWLRTASRQRDMEQAMLDAANSVPIKLSKEQLAALGQDANEQTRLLTLQWATILPIIGSIGDTALSELCDEFIANGAGYRDIRLSSDIASVREANKETRQQAQRIATQIHRRVEELFEAVFIDAAKIG